MRGYVNQSILTFRMTLDEFKRMIESGFGSADADMLGELVATIANMIKGGSNLSLAICSAAQQMYDTLAKDRPPKLADEAYIGMWRDWGDLHNNHAWATKVREQEQ